MPARKQSGGGASWFKQNLELIAQAEEIICARLAKPFSCEHTAKTLCDEVFGVMKACLSGATGSESGSVLVLGEAGSGKSHAVEECLKRLRQEKEGADAVVLRAHGGAYNSDVECMRHLATQVAQQVRELPDDSASFEQSMEWLRAVLMESFRKASAAVIILDMFEHFCSRARQTLLYNLFDVAQEAGVRICIVGMSEVTDVTDQLEKRIKSRISMRHVFAFRPTNMDDLVKVLMSKLRLPEACGRACGLKPAFVAEFNRNVEAALRSRRPQWEPHIHSGRPASWFLCRCVPVKASLFDQTGGADLPPSKRPRTAAVAAGCTLPSATLGEVNDLLVSSLSEVEHIVLIALFRIRDRGLTATMRTSLHEIELLHRDSRLVFPFDSDRYSAAFDTLVQMKLVSLRSPGSLDVGKQHLNCESTVHGMYFNFVCDLEKADSAWRSNPLRGLQGQVQQWAARQRPQE